MPDRILSQPLAQLMTQVVLVAISLDSSSKADRMKQLIGSIYNAEVELCAGRVNPPRPTTLTRGDSTGRGL